MNQDLDTLICRHNLAVFGWDLSEITSFNT